MEAHTPEHAITTEGMTMEFLPDVGIRNEAQNEEKWHNLL